MAYPNPHARPGQGGRFAALEDKLGNRPGVHDPAALAAWIGRQKYGSHRFGQMAVHGAAGGFQGLVTKPTAFLAGEGGQPENVNIQPMGPAGPPPMGPPMGPPPPQASLGAFADLLRQAMTMYAQAISGPPAPPPMAGPPMAGPPGLPPGLI